MTPDPTKLIEAAGIETPLIGFYDVADPKPFGPFAPLKRCYFASYENWLAGESVCISVGEPQCRGGRYWIGGVMPVAREEFGSGLNQREGFKSSDELMCRWLENQKPYEIENGYVVIGPLKPGHYEDLRTVTFFVNPDQLSLLLLGTEYNNASPETTPAAAPFGSGCGQMAAMLGDLTSKTPRAVIGATDVAMRIHLPPNILAFTVNKPMYEQLCGLDESSFLYKHFWKRLRNVRAGVTDEGTPAGGK